MSLTSYLKDSNSQVRGFIEKSAPLLATSGTSRIISRDAALALQFEHLVNKPIKIQSPKTDYPRFTPQLIGSALEFRARMEIDPVLNPFDEDLFQNYKESLHRKRFLSKLDRFIAQGVSAVYKTSKFPGASGVERDRYSLVLAVMKRAYDAVPAIDLDKGLLFFGESLNWSWEGILNRDSIYSENVRDLRLESSCILEKWSGLKKRGENFKSTPKFEGYERIGEVNGDWIIGETLIESKTVIKMDRSKLREILLQLIGCILLDLNDHHKIRSVGIWHTRAGVYKQWELGELLNCETGEALEVRLISLRKEFHELLAKT